MLGHKFEHKVTEKYLTKPNSFWKIPGPHDISQTSDESPTQLKPKSIQILCMVSAERKG